MAITQTTLAADFPASSLTMKVASGTGFPPAGPTIANPGYVVRIDKEFMLAFQQPVAGVIKVAQRGYNGTVAAPHDILSKVEVSATGADFVNPPAGTDVSLPPYLPNQVTIGEDVEITANAVFALGAQPTIFQITKATAAAITLAAPSTAQDGLTVTFTSTTAAAHVITATALLADGAAGSPEDTATFAAFIGAGTVLQAQNGLWNVLSLTGVTIA